MKGDVSFTSYGIDVSFVLPGQHEDHIQKVIASTHNFYESDLLSDVFPRIRPGALVVDVGANIGNHTVFFGKVCRARVIAFEPLPQAREILLANVRLNEIEDRVEVRQEALGAVTASGNFSPISARNIGQTMIRREDHAGGPVHVVRLDDVIGDQNVDLIKIDTEGMELEVIRGAEEAIRRNRPLIYAEAARLESLAQLEQLLSAFEYVVIDRFASTPTFLFAHIADERQRHLSLIHRTSNVNRELRVLVDNVAKLKKANEQSSANLAQIVATGATAEAGITSLQASITESAEGVKVGIASLNERILESGADVKAGFHILDAAAAKLQASSEKCETEIVALKGQVQILGKHDVSREMQDLKLQIEDVLTDYRENILRLQNENSVLRHQKEAFEKKITLMYRTNTWKLRSKFLGLLSTFTTIKRPFSEKQFFDKVKRDVPPKRDLVARGPKIASPVYPVAAADSAATYSNNTFAGIAAIPGRRDALRQTIASLLPQVDSIGVYLNDWDDIPEFLLHPKITVARSQEHGELGDAGKFFWIEQFDGFYFSCDDDIVYPAYYVERLVDKLKDYGYAAAVGWHGSLIKGNFANYYTSTSRRVFGFQHHRPWDTPVHILGTGCAAFHTSTMKVRLSDFPEPNMADVFFAILGQQQRVPFIVVQHDKGELIEIEGTQESSIQSHSRARLPSNKNTGARQSALIGTITGWRTFEWRPLRIGLVGRFENYTKGGIFKSCNLIAKSLRARGHHVTVLDTQSELKEVDPSLDLVWFYPGDPNRPDFATVEEKMAVYRNAGIPVLVNLSYLYEGNRSKWIAQKLREYNGRSDLPPVMAAVFAESVIDDPELVAVKDLIVFVPKTIEPTKAAFIPDFHDREGICFGDSTKLANSAIIGGDVRPWIDAVSRRLPQVNLYAFKQYSGASAHKHLQTVPHMTDDFGNFLAARRLFINLNVHLTFEMVGCEAQSYGTPLLYRHMPHSLSEYVGPTGVRVRSPLELGELAAWLYNDESAWREYSKASIHNAAAITFDNVHSALEASLRLALVRARNLKRKP